MLSRRPRPKSDNARVCALESAHYLRNQLLRDSDWAGMAHSLEIRVPFIDSTFLRSLAPVIPALAPGVGKGVLAAVPKVPLPKEVVTRAKTGFSVPMNKWMDACTRETGSADVPVKNRKGLVSRRWSRAVINGALLHKRELEAQAS